MNHQSHHHHHLTCHVDIQTNIQTQTEKIPHHLHHPTKDPNGSHQNGSHQLGSPQIIITDKQTLPQT